IERADRARAGDDGLPRFGASRASPDGGGDERAAPRNGAHPAIGPVQSCPPDLGQAVDGRRGEIVREALMRGLSAALALLLLLAGGGEEMPPEEQARQDARDVAMVEAANQAAPPLRPITP